MKRTLLAALLVAAATVACSEPLRAPDRQPPRTVTRVVNGHTWRLTIDGAVATVTMDGRPAMQLRREGTLRRLTVWRSDGRVEERTFTERELAAARAARPNVPAPSRDLMTDPGLVREQPSCIGEWITYVGAALVTSIVCVETGASPACAAALSAAANALEA
ncbi:MAG TPA: hypothetical protein VFS05_03630, partial [Gemmatimonadaceae bacterium]|nr:hypothetical protein [Gemmatimonadaceae bacterium]